MNARPSKQNHTAFAASATFASVTLATLLFTACGDNRELPPEEQPPEPPATLFAYALGSDFTNGVFSQIDVLSNKAVPDIVSGVASGDAVLSRYNGGFAITNRGNNNVTFLRNSPLSLLKQVSTGEGTNPQNVVEIGGKFYVALSGITTGPEDLGFAIIDPAADYSVTLVSLPVSDADDQPDCNAVFAVGTDLFVTCQLLNTFVADEAGVIVKYDTTQAPTVEAAFATADLVERNPVSRLVQTPADSFFAGKLLVAATPDYFDLSKGCVLAIDPSSLASTCVVNYSALGGDVAKLVVDAEAGKVFAVVRQGYVDINVGKVVSISLLDGTVDNTEITATGVFTDAAVCSNGTVVVADATTGDSGIRLFADGTELTSSKISIGLPPAFVDALACN